jgi:hypothetical protein
MKISDDHTTSDPHRLRSILTQLLVCCSCLALIIIYFDGAPLPLSAFAVVAMGVLAADGDCYAVQDGLAVRWGWQS